MTVSIFITGATGYIGGAVLYKLLEKKDAYHISALVRTKDKADQIAVLGVRPVVGSLDNKGIIAEESYKADVVIHTANSDHFPSARAIVEGIQRRFNETGKRGILIQTSGSGIVSVPTKGQSATSEIYQDDNIEQINSIPITNPHRDVDTFLLDHVPAIADIAIVAPTTIYGRAHILEGISNPISVQIPLAIKAALKAKKPQQIGKGLNIWSNVHIEDVADLFILLLEKLLKGELNTSESQGYYFVENGEHSWKEVHAEIGRILVNKGLATDATVAEVNTDEEVVAAFGFPEAAYYIGTNSRVKANKARKIGWIPKHADAIKSIEADFDYLLSHQ